MTMVALKKERTFGLTLLHGFVVIVLCQLAILRSVAQTSMDSVFVAPESTTTMSLDEFYKIILTNHPIARQAELLSEVAKQEVRLARGNFDPKIVSQVEHKEFQDKTYYSKWDASISFPVWFPVDPKIGFQQNKGELLNPDETIPGNQQLYAGVSIPIGRGLFTDERRTAVKQAHLFQSMATAEQVSLLNKLLLKAAKDYWKWYYTYYYLELINQSTDIAAEILRRTKLNVQLGEAAPIDTVQAKITLQTRLVERQEAWVSFQNAAINLSNYLWDAAGEPLDLKTSVIPILTAIDRQKLQQETLEELIVQARDNHPELIKLSTKLNQLELDRKLAVENLKPRLDLNYSALSQPSVAIDPLNDYKLGLDFSLPILLRKERSKLAQTKLKIQSTTYEQQLTEREIVNEINALFNTLRNINAIIAQQTEMVSLYDQLLQAELLNLENGESDLFKINIQQEKLVQAQSKLLKLRSTYEEQKAELYWAAGVRNLSYSIVP